ncbi:MAG: DivIVA domain-containing protein [Cyclobacteriaceae bacterium]|jgi:cell division initiation protein|nr:DivIVA domain-containing protein [Cyclobacteriaceae bacterium]
MRITPLEIRQKTFEKDFRGFNKDEVNAFLLTLSQEWERTQDEVKELRIKLESAEREVSKLREVESSLYKTLKTAEDTGANVIEQARQAADLHLRETNLKAEALLNEAKTSARNTIEQAETQAKEIVAEMEDRLKAMLENYKRLEQAREDLMADMKRVASEMLDRVSRATNNQSQFDADQHLKHVKANTRKAEPTPVTPKVEVLTEQVTIEKELVAEVIKPANKPVFKSFFDEIE